MNYWAVQSGVLKEYLIDSDEVGDEARKRVSGVSIFKT